MTDKLLRGTRASVAVAVGVGALVAAVGIWAQTPALVGVGYDDAIYALLARALADGEGYRLLHLPDALPGVKYPPLYPLTLVPFWLLADSQAAALHAMKLANGVLMGAAAALFVFALAELRIASRRVAAALGVVGFVAGSMMLVGTYLLAEPLYMVILYAALWLTDRDDASPIAALAILAALAVLTRTIGVALAGAVLVAVWRRAGYRRAIVAGVAMLFLLAPWFVFTMVAGATIPEVLVPRYGSYLQLYLTSVGGSPARALDVFSTNLGAVLQTLGGKFLPGTGPVIDSLVGAAVLGLALLGSLRIYSRAPATAVYPWLYLLIVLLWTFPPFRFLFVLYPLLLALAAVSCIVLARKAASRFGARSHRVRQVATALGVAVLVYLGYREAGSVLRRVWEGPQLASSTVANQVVGWAMENTAPEAVIAFEFDPLLALHTGRKAVPNTYSPIHVWYQREPPPVEPLVRLLTELGVEFIAVRPWIPAAAAPTDALLGRYPQSLRIVHRTSDGVLIFRTDLDLLRFATAGPGSALGPPRKIP